MQGDPEHLVDRVRVRLAASASPPTQAALLDAVRAESALLGQQEVLDLAGRLHAEMLGAGPLEPVLAEPEVTDVVVNGPREVYCDRGKGLERVDVAFPDADAVRRLAVRLATTCGRRIDEAVPWVDATLPTGVRLHAVLPPIAPDGPLLSLRVVGRRPMSMTRLRETGSVPAGLHTWLERLMACRVSFLVTGGTGAGKTTVLAALLSLVPAAERLVLVEDTRELRPDHPHTVRLLSRQANVEGVGAVGLDVLVRQALRMRPDRLVVGEVRGAEVVDLLAALNTGHDGGCGTVHANSSADVPARVEALGVAAGLDRTAVHSQLAAGVRVVVHVARAAGRRRVAELAVVRRVGAEVVVVPGLLHGPDGRLVPGPAADELSQLLEAAP